jgi:hypothetical protein
VADAVTAPSLRRVADSMNSPLFAWPGGRATPLSRCPVDLLVLGWNDAEASRVTLLPVTPGEKA